MSEVTERGNFVIFWSGWPSQWHPSPFRVDGVPYNCCEQYMMAEKARLFGDAAALGKILASESPRKQKSLGRKVANFESERWNAVCRDVVYRGNLAKFSQNDDLSAVLLATGE